MCVCGYVLIEIELYTIVANAFRPNIIVDLVSIGWYFLLPIELKLSDKYVLHLTHSHSRSRSHTLPSIDGRAVAWHAFPVAKQISLLLLASFIIATVDLLPFCTHFAHYSVCVVSTLIWRDKKRDSQTF